jgi:hypothetical protein
MYIIFSFFLSFFFPFFLSHSQGELNSFLTALASNQCLESLDISGHRICYTGGGGMKLLLNVIQNSKITELFWDDNLIGYQGKLLFLLFYYFYYFILLFLL